MAPGYSLGAAVQSLKRLWTTLTLALASVMLASCHGPGGSWAWWEITLLVIAIIVVLILIIIAVIAIGPEVLFGILIDIIVTIVEAVVTAIAAIISRLWIFLLETAWPWIVRQARWIWSLLVRLWNWLSTVAWLWIKSLPGVVWTWFKGTRLGKILIGLGLWGGSNPVWDAIKAGWAWLWGIGPPTLVYPPTSIACGTSTVLTSTMTRTETENDYPFFMTGAAVAAAAATSATTSATSAAIADLWAQFAAVNCAGPCAKIPIGPAVVSVTTTPATKASHALSFYDSYTVTATVTVTLTVQCL